jgi:hypothetical protein
MYFSFFPKVHTYPIQIVGQNNTKKFDSNISFDNIYKNAAVDFNKKNEYYFLRERILNGERPDQLSARLYGSSNYFWTFFIINDHLRLGEQLQWPMDETQLRIKISNDYSGKALIAFKSRYIRGFWPRLSIIKDNSSIFKNFIIGETIVGLKSGARGTLVELRPNFGQIIIEPQTLQVDFSKTEKIQGETSGSSIFIHDVIEYSFAPMYYVDEEGREASHPNFITLNQTVNETLFTPVSFREHFFQINEELSNIRVLQKSSLLKFEDAFRTVINRKNVI